MKTFTGPSTNSNQKENEKKKKLEWQLLTFLGCTEMQKKATAMLFQ